MLLNKKVLDIFADPKPFTVLEPFLKKIQEEDYNYLAAYLNFKVEGLKSAPWIKNVTEGKDPDATLKEILVAIIQVFFTFLLSSPHEQSLALTQDLLVSQSTDQDYAKNMEFLQNVAYLPKKEFKSNRGSPQCIVAHCKTLAPPTFDKPEEPLPFKIQLGVYDPADYEKSEGDKDSIKLDLSLV